jgi:hypothetical protein
MSLPFIENNKNNNFLNKILNYSYYFFWIICLIFLLYQVLKDFDQFSKIIKIQFKEFFFILIFFILNLNIANYRFFYFLKKMNKYSDGYVNWSRLFFQTVLMNFFFFGSGHLFRSVQLKKKNVKYTEFITLNYVFSLLILIVSSSLFLFFFFLITINKFILLYLIIFLSISFILIHNRFYYVSSIFLKKNLKFIKKKYKDVFINMLFYCKKFFLFKKNILVFLLFTLIIFLLDGITFYLLSSSILFNKDFYIILLFFVFVFYLNRIPYVSNLVGLNEIFVGLFAETLGFYFLQGSLVQLMYRLFSYISCIFCSILYFLICLKNNAKVKIKN